MPAIFKGKTDAGYHLRHIFHRTSASAAERRASTLAAGQLLATALAGSAGLTSKAAAAAVVQQLPATGAAAGQSCICGSGQEALLLQQGADLAVYSWAFAEHMPECVADFTQVMPV